MFIYKIGKMSLKLYAVPLLLAGILISCTKKQAEAPVFRYPNGTELTRLQVDSLRDLYGRYLTLNTQNEGDMVVTTVKLPGTLSYSDEKASGSDTELIFIDTLGNELQQETFWKGLAELEWPAVYEEQFRNGDSVVVVKQKKPVSLKEYLAANDSSLINKWEGKMFPFNTLTGLDQVRFKPGDFENKVVVLNYWFTTCAPCI